VAWVAGLLDGSPVSKAWLSTRASLAGCDRAGDGGAAGPEVIADELERDPTDIGRRAAAGARAAARRPKPRPEAWEAIIRRSGPGPRTKKAIAEDSTARPGIPAAAYVQPYFETVVPFWESHDIDESLMFVKSMYSMTIVRPDVGS